MFKIAWDPSYTLPLPEKHRFPMEKYQLLPEQLLYENTLNETQFFSPEPLSGAEMLLVHSADYVERMLGNTLSNKELRTIGFPRSEALIHRERVIMQGTVQAARLALEHGIAANIAGGTHHAFADRGEGFCLMNDFALAATILLREKRVQNILIFDLDVHQGNGTAHIFRDDPRVFTFSMHGRHNYPHHKEKSDIDIELEDGTGDREYLKLTAEWIARALDMATPDIVFYLCGADVLATDKLGRISLTREGCRLRDRLVLETCRKNGVPLCFAPGGGYSPRLADIVEAHANTFRLAAELYG